MFNGLRLLRAECLRVFGDVKNYWFNYLLGNLNVFFMFFGLFFTFSKNQGASLDKLLFLFGLMYWYFGTHAIDLVSLLMEEEIEQGTLEQLLMTRIPLAVSFGFRIAAQVLFDLCKGLLVFVLCMWSFGIDFALAANVRFLLSIVVFFWSLAAMYGAGYIVAGFSLVYKQASSLASLSSSLILFFSGTTIEISAFPSAIQFLIQCFPFYWSNQAIGQILLGKTDTLAFCLFMMELEFFVWLFGGVWIFHRCLNRVYRSGTTASY